MLLLRGGLLALDLEWPVRVLGCHVHNLPALVRGLSAARVVRLRWRRAISVPFGLLLPDWISRSPAGLPLRRDSVYLWHGDLRPELQDQLMAPAPIPDLPGLVERAICRSATRTTTMTTARLPAPEEAEFQIADSAPLLVVLLAGWDANDLAVWAAEFVWPAERVALVDIQTHRPGARRP